MSSNKDEYVTIPVEWLHDRLKEYSKKIMEHGSSEYFIPKIMLINEIIKEFTVNPEEESK